MPNLTPSSIPSKILDIWRKNYCYQGHQVVKDPSHHKDLQFTLLVQAQLTKQLPGIACGNCAAWTALAAASMLHDVRVLCLFPAQWHVWRKCTPMLWPHTDPQEDFLQVSKSTQELCDGSDWQDRSKEHARAVVLRHRRSSEAVAPITRPLSRSFSMRRGHVQGNCACGWYLDFQAANDRSHRAVVFPLGLVPAGASSCQEYRRSEPSPFVADLSWVVIIARQYINHQSRAMPWHYQLGPCVSVI
ncbi:hypothetical protein M438DRAFT_141410 [Aureobasidium pullulans EXF-150]|uniref:Uncharacterized protein n=1 Tax=Aureobasidium pullulans EXF-150 TaxID=1043002 RepID=A0A074X2W8_AURPU|nr:uncharacterized protein M438DRAFT_141410 [Aureobasidium pullulans EXF-150]KEQ79718.1 hypothetical protein M438DRAFT_141410 [Aureobasidium pullulans EXF-150]